VIEEIQKLIVTQQGATPTIGDTRPATTLQKSRMGLPLTRFLADANGRTIFNDLLA
jgi:hypothetical protein